MAIQCKVCKREPKDLGSVVYHAKVEEMEPDEFVKEFDGTYNPQTEEFFCNTCYINIGIPLGTA